MRENGPMSPRDSVLISRAPNALVLYLESQIHTQIRYPSRTKIWPRFHTPDFASSTMVPVSAQHEGPDLPMNYDNMPSANRDVLKDEGLKQAFTDLCNACRAGDTDTVDSLLSTPNLDINRVDEWDYLPLILASLCGHLKIVELLLSRGATCDRDTFQGARCVYGALNDTIRDLLISFDISKKVDISQPFAGHISSLLNPLNQLANRDIVFYFPHAKGTLSRDHQVFTLNRFILAARSPYFHKKVLAGGEWASKAVVEMPSSTNTTVFKTLVDYIYLRTDSLPIDQESIRQQLAQFASKLGLQELLDGIERIKDVVGDKEKAKIKHDLSFVYMERARKDLEEFLKNHVLENKVVCSLEIDQENEDIDFEDIDTVRYLSEEKKSRLLEASSVPDIILTSVDIDTETVNFYPAHKAIVARSEYFETMLKSDIFLSSHEPIPEYRDDEKSHNRVIVCRPEIHSGHIAVIQLSNSSTSHRVAEILLTFLYYDEVAHIPLMLTVDLLFAADELFLERLKTMCAVNITARFPELTFDEFRSLPGEIGYNAYDLIKIAWQTRCERLEQYVTRFIAHNLGSIYKDPEQTRQLCELIRESSERIQKRQDTDTIELVDDIRYYLSKKYSVNDEFEDFAPINFVGEERVAAGDIRAYQTAMVRYERDIEMIDQLLDLLELDA